MKRGLVARSCARSGRKDVVGEVKGIEMMGVLIAGRGARERGDRRLKVKVASSALSNVFLGLVAQRRPSLSTVLHTPPHFE